jgi:ABC-type phosphate transport system permease subunit
MYSIDIVFGAWLFVALAALAVPLVILVGEWALKPLSDWLRESQAALSSSVEELVASSQNPVSSRS